MAFNRVVKKYKHLLEDKDFLSLNNYKERIEYVLTKVQFLHTFKEELFKKADNYWLNHRKSRQISQSFRCEGQYYFECKQYNSAKECFTNAILFAPFYSAEESDTSRELSLSYASRSLTFFELELYEDAIFDANQSIYWSESVEMLFHKTLCLLLLNKFQEMNELINECIKRFDRKELNSKIFTKDRFIDLKDSIVKDVEHSGEVKAVESLKEKLKQMSNFFIHPYIEIKNSAKKGRHFVAKEYISKKSLILFEKPFNVINFQQNVYEFCANCHIKVGYKIWPCSLCNEVVFCGKLCAEEAFYMFHKYECGIIGLLMSLGSDVLHVFRLFVKIGPKNAINCELTVREKGFDVYEYVNDRTQQTTAENEKTESQKWTQFAFISTLVNHIDKHNKNDWIYYTFTAIEIAIFLNYNQALDMDIMTDIKLFLEFTDIVCTYMSRVLTNVFGWYVDNENPNCLHVANCLFLIASLINHSCDPNTNWNFCDKYIVFETIRDIEPGEEINNTYGLIETTPLIERHNRLKTNYHFDCNCKACLKGIRTIRSLQCLECKGPVVCGLESQDNSCLECGTKYETMSKTIKTLNSFRQEFEEMVKNVQKDSNRDNSLNLAQKKLKSIIDLVYNLSEDLLTPIRQLLRIYHQIGDKQKAIDCSKYLLPSIQLNQSDCSKVFADIFDDLFLLTQLYYCHLSDNQIKDDTEWQIAFQIYNKLIGLLENIENKKQQNPEKYNSIQLLKNVIKDKKEELKHLKHIFSNL